MQVTGAVGIHLLLGHYLAVFRLGQLGWLSTNRAHSLLVHAMRDTTYANA